MREGEGDKCERGIRANSVIGGGSDRGRGAGTD